MPHVGDGDKAVEEPDFPMVEAVVDPWGKEHRFAIELRTMESGHFLRATESTPGRGGYEFAAYASGSPFLALGRLRARIREGVATRYLVTEQGERRLGHDKAVGRIGFNSVVIDGQELSFEELAELLQAYEGWQFQLTISDPYDPM